MSFPRDGDDPASVRVTRQIWRRDAATPALPQNGERILAEEVAVALTYNGGTQAVMMATPADLEDLAIGFSLTEGIVATPAEIQSIEIAAGPLGIEARMWLAAGRARLLGERRRRQVGPTGCGLCGIESLEDAMRSTPPVSGTWRLSAAEVGAALESLAQAQLLNARTHAVHAAAFWRPGEGLVAVREDVGRHNAVDKLVGALARAGETGTLGALLLTSRVSVELVQKAAIAGFPVLIAVSAPTGLAVETARGAGLTLVAVARADSFEVFTHPHRIGPAHEAQ